MAKLSQLRTQFSFRSSEPIWSGLQMNGEGDWSINGLETVNDAYSDLRRPNSGVWFPSHDVLNINGTTKGCVEVTSGNLLNTKLDEGCEKVRKPACEYKACMTSKGKPCLFPFIYKNQTHPYLEYNICSGLDVYRPWCPTKLDDLQNIIEWGDCLEDCPSEPINSACLSDPIFPAIADGSDHAVNATTEYITGISVVTNEFDYVTFTCPEGYVFKESNNKTHYALCINWEFIYLFDIEANCVCKFNFACNFY